MLTSGELGVDRYLVTLLELPSDTRDSVWSELLPAVNLVIWICDECSSWINSDPIPSLITTGLSIICIEEHRNIMKNAVNPYLSCWNAKPRHFINALGPSFTLLFPSSDAARPQHGDELSSIIFDSSQNRNSLDPLDCTLQFGRPLSSYCIEDVFLL